MNKQLLKDALGWGFALWFIGYAFGIALFAFVPSSMLGWIIMPVGTIVTLVILLKKIKTESLQYYFLLGTVWLSVAIIFDYFFIVKFFKPEDGYYKLDVYLYYIITFFLPIIVGWYRNKYHKEATLGM